MLQMQWIDKRLKNTKVFLHSQYDYSYERLYSRCANNLLHTIHICIILYTYIIHYTHLSTAGFNCQWLTKNFILHLEDYVPHELLLAADAANLQCSTEA